MLQSSSPPRCVVCVDMGTTNTRVWLVRGREIVARAQANIGVRDTARDGSPTRIRAGLRDLIEDVKRQTQSVDASLKPSYVMAAGMITSPLGLAEVPHVPSPAGINELAHGVKSFRFPDVSDLPILLLPGVRCGAANGGIEEIGQRDVMRGEETLCVGLLALGLAQPPATVLNLGSHWKAIQIDAQGRITGSVTSLTGELIHAAQTQTILASAVPPTRPTAIEPTWCEAGMAEQRRSGLARALFCVRLLELSGKTKPEERLSYLMGAFLAADLDALLKRGVLEARSRVLISGGGVLAGAWQNALEKASITAAPLTEEEIERGLLAGLRCVAEVRSPPV